jgi:hypothetical protein
MTCYDMRMRVGPKNAGQLPYSMTVQVWSLIRFGQKIPQFRFILKAFLFSVWVPISEERKANPRKSYLRTLMRIAESLYSGGRVSISGSTYAYVRSESASISASGSEPTILPIINLNLVYVSFYIF